MTEFSNVNPENTKREVVSGNGSSSNHATMMIAGRTVAKGTAEKQDVQGFVHVNSEHLTKQSITELTCTRLGTIKAILPTIHNPLENEVTFYAKPQTTSRIFDKSSIPSIAILQSWKEQLYQHSTDLPVSTTGQYYIEVRDHRYSRENIEHMFLLHKAKDIRCAVDKELEWFAGRMNMPKGVVKHPSSESLKQFQDLVFGHKWDEELDGYGMTGQQLAKICGNRCISGDIIEWVLDLLNTTQTDTHCVYYDQRTGGEKYVNKYRRKEAGNTTPVSLFFVFSVGCSNNGVFVASHTHPGSHFSFCHMTHHVTAAEGKGNMNILYGDCLGWAAPSNLKEILSSYYTAIFNRQLLNYDLVLCHQPQSTTFSYEHKCSTETLPTCMQCFPIQTDGNMGGVITLMMAALACLKKDCFDFLTTAISDDKDWASLSHNLQHLIDPSGNTKYLRRVLATWFADKEICVDFIVPKEFDEDPGGGDGLAGVGSEEQMLIGSEPEQIGLLNRTSEHDPIVENDPDSKVVANDASKLNHIKLRQSKDDNAKSSNVQLNSAYKTSRTDGIQDDFLEKSHQHSVLTGDSLVELLQEDELVSSGLVSVASINDSHKCPKCSYTTKLIFNMKRHIKRRHKDITYTPPSIHSCPSCSYISDKAYDVYQHVNHLHPDVQWMTRPHRRGPKAKDGPKRHGCPQCSYQSNSKHNINRHQESCHEVTQTIQSSRTGKCQCLECGQRLYKISDLRRHLSKKHAFIFKIETVTLDSYQGFEDWKASMEISEGCSFTKSTGDKVIQGSKRTQYFQCNRSGVFRSNNKGKRRQKWQGSCKIESNCTSTMVASILDNGQVEVECVCTHYSHQIELQHVWIPKGHKQDKITMAKGNQGSVNRDQILDEIHNSVSRDYGRCRLSGAQEIPDIIDMIQIKPIDENRTSDQLCLLGLIKQWDATDGEHSPVLCYKFAGNTDLMDSGVKRDEFITVIQTELQKEMMQKFCYKGICCDSTIVSLSQEYALMTLQLVDKFETVHSVAWCLGSSDKRAFIDIFFNRIKEKCGVLAPAWFMSNLTDVFHDAWTRVFGSTTKRLICPWSVDRSWRDHLKKTIGNVSIECRVYRGLRTLMEQNEMNLFEDHLQSLLEQLSWSTKTKEFHSYFLTQWVSRQHQWTYCNNHYTTNTSAKAFIKPFYTAFSIQYPQPATLKDRLDVFVMHLLKYARDGLMTRRINLTTGKPIGHKAVDVETSHNASVKMSTEFSIRPCQQDSHRWEVVADNQVIHTVQECAAICKLRKCPISCTHCHICAHRYLCSCLESLTTTSICKHIHLVHGFLHTETPVVPRDTQWLKDRIQSRMHRLMEVVNSATDDDFSTLRDLDSKLAVCSSALDSRLLWGLDDVGTRRKMDASSSGSMGGVFRKGKRKTILADNDAKMKQSKKDEGGLCQKSNAKRLILSVPETVPIPSVTNLDCHSKPPHTQSADMPVAINTQAANYQANTQQQASSIATQRPQPQQMTPLIMAHLAHHSPRPNCSTATSYPPSKTIPSLAPDTNHSPVDPQTSVLSITGEGHSTASTSGVIIPNMDHSAPIMSHPFSGLSHHHPHQINTQDSALTHHHLNTLTFPQPNTQTMPGSQLVIPGTSSAQHQTSIDNRQRSGHMGQTETQQQLSTMSDEQLTTLAGVAVLFGEG